jgi:prepilin-type N-terminal cleavage/methylation domain-containing protein
MEMPRTSRCFWAQSGMTMLETMVASTIFALAIALVYYPLQSLTKSVNMQMAVSHEEQLTEAFVDKLLIAARWASSSDPNLICNFPSESAGMPTTPPPTPFTGTGGVLASVNNSSSTWSSHWNSAYPPMFSFHRIKCVNPSYTASSGVAGTTAQASYYLFGDIITYYWLPSPHEYTKYANGDMTQWNAADVDGLDHGNDGVMNAGVIWRRIDMDPTLTQATNCIQALGPETFPVGMTPIIEVVLDNVPPPFYTQNGVQYPTDSFKVLVNFNDQLMKICVKRFVDTGASGVSPSMQFTDMDYGNTNQIPTSFIQINNQSGLGSVNDTFTQGTPGLPILIGKSGGGGSGGGGGSSSSNLTFWTLDGVSSANAPTTCTVNQMNANAAVVVKPSVTITTSRRSFCVRN